MVQREEAKRAKDEVGQQRIRDDEGEWRENQTRSLHNIVLLQEAMLKSLKVPLVPINKKQRDWEEERNEALKHKKKEREEEEYDM